MKKVRITFRSEIYLEGDSLDSIRDKWENIPLFSADALEHSAEFVELNTVEQIYGDSVKEDVTNRFKNATSESLLWEDSFLEEGLS